MASSAVRDARTVILVERILNAGYVIRSERRAFRFTVTLSKDEHETYTGTGFTFPEACLDALCDLDAAITS